jgi:SHS2 domain-containing protein
MTEQLKDTNADIAAIFSGEGLSEEFKSNAKSIFEAAILAKVSEETARLEEEFEAKLVEEVQSINENLVTKIDEYLEYVVTEWMGENKLAIETGIKAELAEDFMVGLKNLFVEHYVDIPEDKVEIVEEFAQQVEILESELDKAITDNVSLVEEINGYKKEKIVADISEGLTEVQLAKLKSLSENIEFITENDYKQKLLLTKKKYFDESDSDEVVTKSNQMDEETSTLEESFSPVMSHYVQNISRTLKK